MDSIESIWAAAIASASSAPAAADLERVADVQRALQVVERAACVDRIGAEEVRLAEIRAGQDRAVQLGANQIGFDEIRVGEVGAAQIRVHQIGRVQRRATETHAGKVDAGENRPVQYGAVEHDDEVGLFQTPMVPGVRAELQAQEKIGGTRSCYVGNEGAARGGSSLRLHHLHGALDATDAGLGPFRVLDRFDVLPLMREAQLLPAVPR